MPRPVRPHRAHKRNDEPFPEIYTTLRSSMAGRDLRLREALRGPGRRQGFADIRRGGWLESGQVLPVQFGQALARIGYFLEPDRRGAVPGGTGEGRRAHTLLITERLVRKLGRVPPFGSGDTGPAAPFSG